MNVTLHTPQTVRGNMDIQVLHDAQPYNIIFSLLTEYEGVKKPTVTLHVHMKDGESIYISHEYNVRESGNAWKMNGVFRLRYILEWNIQYIFLCRKVKNCVF